MLALTLAIIQKWRDLKIWPHLGQHPKHTIPCLLSAYRKPSIMDGLRRSYCGCPNGVRFEGFHCAPKQRSKRKTFWCETAPGKHQFHAWQLRSWHFTVLTCDSNQVKTVLFYTEYLLFYVPTSDLHTELSILFIAETGTELSYFPSLVSANQ